ncbi:MAG: hypothetical protein H7A37_04550 [Chlamydiales bacterium]|nr:hypothetical protein [Chlamydiales bacterium]
MLNPDGHRHIAGGWQQARRSPYARGAFHDVTWFHSIADGIFSMFR